MKTGKHQEAEADRLNGHDVTDDAIKEVPRASDAGEAVEALTSHLNKYDKPDDGELR
ncbi:hypothetical protein KIH86_02570 [Paenibacillus sp. HN-1]|uniref:hypothetical protein n=1 Tax=Paenibacillus TaxID=44249 RepID=UPI001CA9D3A5|nr:MULTISPECIES: hypothetical protein [Paenibacillus]MBY9080224.1 hypothetical protein [Paenibacillus sp. CGMCC 1.18879]MBY9083117.1 hypothetical protein [Paenibacillus sinensis]